MARLETQINQIYLIHPENKKTSLILYEESLASSLHLFVISELKDVQRKSEVQDLKKISEIILASFRNNKKLPPETLFETALAQINQNLADLAHEGRKSWVGKFSCLITLKANDNIYLANNGQTTAKLLRHGEIMEILPAEKRGDHPLKTFQNFTQGKISDSDSLILTTANIFNFVALDLFTKILGESDLETACIKISKILQDSVGSSEAFSSFFLNFSKKPVAVETSEPMESSVNYTPVPEEIEETPAAAFSFPSILPLKFKIPKLQFRLPNLKKPSWLPKFGKFQWSFFQRLSLAGKFFFISFSIFLVLSLITLTIKGFELRDKNQVKKINQQATLVSEDMAEAQSALIYKNNEQAFKFLGQAKTDYETLLKLSPTRAEEFTVKLAQLTDQINKTSTVNDPKLEAEFKHHPIYLAKSPSGFLLAGTDSNSVSLYDGSSKDYFLLNSLKTDITSVSYWQTAGTIVSVADKIYYINNNLKQYEPLLSLDNSNIVRIKTYNNNLYALDTKNNQLKKVVVSKNAYTSQVSASGSFTDARDFAIDKDIYVLFPDHITKITSGQAQAFPFPFLTDQITNAARIFIASNIYILEPNKKRVVILSKTGALINQIYFPTTSTLLDLYVDEPSRSLYLLDDNKFFKITF